MKLLFFVLFAIGIYRQTQPTLTELRNSYQQAAVQKAAAEKLNQLVAVVDTGAAPVLVGYKGANEMIQAKYVISPLAKLNKFSRGKMLLQLAVNRDTANLETRFLRFCIQSNSPSFVNYNHELAADKRFLIASTPGSTDGELKKMIIDYFLATNSLTDTQLKQIKN